MQDLRVTVVQQDILWHSPSGNIKKIDSIMKSISSSDLVLLPEMFTTGFTMKPDDVAEDMDGAAVYSMKEWSREINACIAGSVAIRENRIFFNRFIAVFPDGGVVSYDKRHLFRMAGEEKVYTSGKNNVTFEFKGWRIRPFICYDLRFPVWSRNSSDGYDLAVYAANWPAVRSFHWDTLLRARAIENQCYVAGINRTGADGNGVKYCGGSCILGFRGDTVYSAGEEPAVNTVLLSYQALVDYRKEFPAWMDSDRFRVTEC